MENKQIGDRIKMVRKERGLTQGELSERLHITQATLARIESGQIDPPLSRIIYIADALNVPIYDLMDIDEHDLSDEDNERLIFIDEIKQFAKHSDINEVRKIRSIIKTIIGDQYVR